MKYLIVDDHPQIRRAVRDLLATTSDDVREAQDGQEAVAAFEEQRPDWVIMDVQMKPVGGLDAARRIVQRHPHARIIIFSQFDDPDLRASARDAGALAYVIKENITDLPDYVRAFGD